MLIQKAFVDVPVTYGTNPNRIFVISPKLDGYPNAKFPGVVVFSEIYQVTGPVERFAISMLSIVRCGDLVVPCSEDSLVK
jgi:carboxymethylenebutenolidase